jgi:hypothetical protein
VTRADVEGIGERRAIGAISRRMIYTLDDTAILRRRTGFMQPVKLEASNAEQKVTRPTASEEARSNGGDAPLDHGLPNASTSVPASAGVAGGERTRASGGSALDGHPVPLFSSPVHRAMRTRPTACQVCDVIAARIRPNPPPMPRTVFTRDDHSKPLTWTTRNRSFFFEFEILGIEGHM